MPRTKPTPPAKKARRKSPSHPTPVEAAAALAADVVDPYELFGQLDDTGAIEDAIVAALPTSYPNLLSSEAECSLYEALQGALPKADQGNLFRFQESLTVRRMVAREAAYLVGVQVGLRLRSVGGAQ